jgi:hypothetical protein
MMANSPTRQDTFRVTLTVDSRDLGVWDKKTGGDVDSNELKYRPGAMGPLQSLGGTTVPSNVTLQRNYDKVRDHDNINFLLSRVGGVRATVHQQPLDLDGNPYGSKAVHWHGTLKRVLVPDVDSEGNAAAMLEVEVSVDEQKGSVAAA